MKRIVSAVLVLFSLVLAFAGVGVAANIGLMGVGGRIGHAVQDEVDNELGFGVVFDLGNIIPPLNIESSVDFLGDTERVYGFSKSSWIYLFFNGTTKYHFPVGDNVSPFVGGGLSFIFARSSLKYINDFDKIFENTSDTNTEFELHLTGGVDIPIGKGRDRICTAEARYIVGEWDIFWLTGAVSFRLGGSR